MKSLAISLFALLILPHVAFADQFECEQDGYCHQIEVTATDLGTVEDANCGSVLVKKAVDGTCHQYSPCGADEGESQQACQ